MKIVDGAQFWLWKWLAQRYGAGQSRQQLGETKTAVETVGGFGQIASRVLGHAHGVVAAADGPFDVAEHHGYPASALDLGRGAIAGGTLYGVRMIQFDGTPEAAQPVAEDLRIRRKTMFSSVHERGIVVAEHRFHDREGGILRRRVSGQGHHERLLIFRSTPHLAAVALATQVGIVDLYETRELTWFLALSHELHDLALELPAGVVTRARAPLQFQRDHVCLTVDQQVHCQKPRRRRLEHRPAGRCRLVPAGAALVIHPACAPKPRSGTSAVFRTAKPLWLARSVRRPVVLGLGPPVSLDKLRHRQPRLELHLIQGHDRPPSCHMAPR